MKKGLGKIRKIKKKHIFLALLAVIVLGGLAKAYSAWVGTTRIAFLNYQAIALGQISHANDNAMIKLSEITTDDFDHLDDYDMIIVNGMGLRIDENQRKQLEEASYKVPTLTHAATNIIRKTKCFRILERNAKISKTKRNFSRLYPTPQKFKKIDRLRRNEIHLKAVRTSS